MTVGRRLWAIILIKLTIMFLVFKLFFFPDKLAEEYDNDADRARAVRSSLVGDPPPPPTPPPPHPLVCHFLQTILL